MAFGLSQQKAIYKPNQSGITAISGSGYGIKEVPVTVSTVDLTKHRLVFSYISGIDANGVLLNCYARMSSSTTLIVGQSAAKGNSNNLSDGVVYWTIEERID
jgi:hypothetical protein